MHHFKGVHGLYLAPCSEIKYSYSNGISWLCCSEAVLQAYIDMIVSRIWRRNQQRYNSSTQLKSCQEMWCLSWNMMSQFSLCSMFSMFWTDWSSLEWQHISWPDDAPPPLPPPFFKNLYTPVQKLQSLTETSNLAKYLYVLYTAIQCILFVHHKSCQNNNVTGCTPSRAVWGVCKQWTGLLDWNTGLDYWTGLLDCTEHSQKLCIYIVAWVGLGSHHADVHALTCIQCTCTVHCTCTCTCTCNVYMYL